MKACVLVLLAASTAHAGVAGELGAGGGGDTTATGYTVAEGSLAIELARAPVPLARRGLVMPGDEGETSLWLFTGTGDDDRDHVGADVSALARGSTYIGSAHAEARGAGWQLSGGVALQPLGSLRDRFWRSGRDVVATSIGFEVPAAFTIGSASERLGFGGMSFTYTGRSLRDGAARIDGGSDGEADVRFVHYETPNATGDAFVLHDVEYELVQTATADGSSGVSAQSLSLDVLALAWRFQPRLELRAHGGFDSLRPTATYTQNASNMVTDNGPHRDVPRYWLELAEHRGERTLSLGGGSWARLDPTGNAADAGQLASGSFEDRMWRLHVRGGIEMGRLRRVLLGPFATDSLAPAGTRMWMGRGELATSIALAHGVAVSGQAWVERSDRDDPRWAVPATGALATHAGADVTASWRFRKL